MAGKQLMLKVGDVLYGKYNNKVVSKISIRRVTKTQAISSTGIRFKRAYQKSFGINLIPYEGYSQRSYWIGTPKLETAFKVTKMLSYVTAIRWGELSDSTIKKVYKIVRGGA